MAKRKTTDVTSAELTYKGRKYQVSIETIDAAAAQYYLDHMGLNRNPKKQSIKELCAAFHAGHWDDVNGDTICFDNKNKLTDGQNRMRMLVATGGRITTFVIRGLDKGIPWGKDRGRPRRVEDCLCMAGEKEVNVLGGVLRHMHMFQCDRLSGLHHGVSLYTPWDARFADDLLTKHPGIRQAVNVGRSYYKGQSVKILGAGVYGFLSYVLPHIDETMACEFLSEISYRKIQPNSPVNYLRKRLELHKSGKQQAHKLSGLQILGMVIRCWNLYVQGLEATGLRSIMGRFGSFPDFLDADGAVVKYNTIKWDDTLVENL